MEVSFNYSGEGIDSSFGDGVGERARELAALQPGDGGDVDDRGPSPGDADSVAEMLGDEPQAGEVRVHVAIPVGFRPI